MNFDYLNLRQLLVRSVLAASIMVEEHDLRVLFALNLDPGRVITGLVHLGVHADDLAIPFVPEQQALVAICVGPEVW